MKYLIFTIVLFLSFGVNAQRIIAGQVVSEDSCGIQGVIVKVQNYRKATKTDSVGNFTLELGANDYYRSLVFSYRGLQTEIISLDSIKNDSLKIVLKSYDEMIFDKPVIYLYPKKEIIIDVKLNFKGEILNTYPEYDNGWQVLAKPNGDLINIKDNSKHRYLFWDGIKSENVKLLNFETGFVVKNDEVLAFLDSSLTKIGLNDYEKNDFITFWMPIMKQNEYNLVYFMIDDECNKVATLNVNPKPDSELRVYILFQKIENPIKITPQILKTVDRNGFVLVEWGGIAL